MPVKYNVKCTNPKCNNIIKSSYGKRNGLCWICWRRENLLNGLGLHKGIPLIFDYYHVTDCKYPNCKEKVNRGAVTPYCIMHRIITNKDLYS